MCAEGGGLLDDDTADPEMGRNEDLWTLARPQLVLALSNSLSHEEIIMTESNQFPDEDEVARIRMRYKAAQAAGMSIAAASAYANDPNSPPLSLLSSAQVQSRTTTASNGNGGAQLNSGCDAESVAMSPPLSPKPALSVSADNTGRHELDADPLMTKNSGLPESPDGTQPSDAAPAYEVGYGRTPVHSRFKKGHPKRGGRRKGQRNARTAFEGILNEKITLREGKRTRSLSKRDAFFLRLVNDAASGHAKAQSHLIALMRLHGLIEQLQEATTTEPFTTDDGAIIGDFLERHRNQAEPAQPPDSNDKPDTGEAGPPSKQSKETRS
jgi:uncharacterized protein DUF5681